MPTVGHEPETALRSKTTSHFVWTSLIGLLVFSGGSLLFLAVNPHLLVLVRFVQSLGAAALSTRVDRGGDRRERVLGAVGQRPDLFAAAAAAVIGAASLV
jgi:hypothetical protein